MQAPTQTQGPVARAIAAKLTAALAPTFLEIADHSQRHAGHTQQKTASGRVENASETHFFVMIVSAAFDGKSRLDRHRQVTTTLARELAGPVHALSLRCLAPSEIE